MSDIAEDDFWRFSCAVYETVREPLLRLQDDAGLNINMLLLCAWLGRRGYEVSDMAGSCAVAERWEERFIAPLRVVRRRVKQEDAALYEEIKQLELRFEHACQRALQAHVKEGGAKKTSRVRQNIEAYLAHAQKADKKTDDWIKQAVCAIIEPIENFSGV